MSERRKTSPWFRL